MFVHKIIIHSEILYPFNNLLFIYDLLRISLTHVHEMTYLLQPINNGGSKEAQAIIIQSLKRCGPRLQFIEERLCIFILRPCSIDVLQIFFVYPLLICELQIREKCKEMLYTIKKLIVSLILRWPRGVPVLLLGEKALFQTNF